MPSRPAIVISALVLFLVLLAGCGEGDDSADGASDTGVGGSSPLRNGDESDEGSDTADDDSAEDGGFAAANPSKA